MMYYQLSRFIGDVYLKKLEDNIDPIFWKIVLATALKRPALPVEPQIHARKVKPTDQFMIFA